MYYRWTTRKKNVCKIQEEVSGEEASSKLAELVSGTKMRSHKYNIYRQFSELKWLKIFFKENEVILSVDFSKNYDNKQRHEVQSAHSNILKSLHWPERQQVNEEQPDSESGTEEDHTVDELVRKLPILYSSNTKLE